MTILHKKSECCGAPVVRFGGKRRQCASCERTWSIRPAKRGPKPTRKQLGYLKKVFLEGFKVRQIARHSSLSIATLYKRFAKNLDSFVKCQRAIRVAGEDLIIIIDAEWQYFNKELWTLYFVTIRSAKKTTAIALDPILRYGKEGAAVWREIINNLPRSLKKRIVAMVADGIRGIGYIAEEHNWILQSCHFHLLNVLQKMRGKRATTHGREIREKIFQYVKASLTVKSNNQFMTLCNELQGMIKDKGCPKRMRWAVSGYLNRSVAFRNYLNYPKLNLPTTVNVMESINSLFRRRAITIKTPKAWYKWAIAYIRLKSRFNCK